MTSLYTPICSDERSMRAARFCNALENLRQALREIDAALEEVRAEHDPLAAHIFVSRRNYRNTSDSKGGRRRDMEARNSWREACEQFGFRGTLNEWERLLDAPMKR